MDMYEMRTLQESARVVEKFADFAGNVILQLLQKQNYVEEQGIKALLDHVREGGGTLTAAVSEQRAERFQELLKEARIPYVEIEHVDPATQERSVFFVYRDSDRAGMRDVMKRFELELDRSCNEVDLDSFTAMVDKKSYGFAGSLTRTELYAFREAAKDYDIRFCVVADQNGYDIVADNKTMLSHVLSDMCYNISGERGRAYEITLGDWLLKQRDFVEQARPEPGRVKYIVNSKNPSVFMSIDEQGITTHSVGVRQEAMSDGTMKNIIYDCHHVTYPGYDAERLKTLATEMRNPVILSEEEFAMVRGISKTKEAILAEDFVEQFKPFVDSMKQREPDMVRMPVRKPLYKKENLVGLSNLPVIVVEKLARMEIPEMYIDGCDVAYPKEYKEKVDLLLDAFLYQEMTPEEKADAKQFFEAGGENRAMDFMLGIERSERQTIRSSEHLSPEYLNETQREAVERMKQKEIREQPMDREAVKRLKEQDIDRRMWQDQDR